MPTKTPLPPKHLPRRTCVGCGAVTVKRALIRIVRTPEGRVLPDPTGKKAGRGAYLCADQKCWEQAVKRGRLERSLKAHLSVEDIEGLRSFSHDLGPPPTGEAG